MRKNGQTDLLLEEHAVMNKLASLPTNIMTHPHCCPNQYYHHRHPHLHLQPKQRTIITLPKVYLKIIYSL